MNNASSHQNGHPSPTSGDPRRPPSQAKQYVFVNHHAATTESNKATGSSKRANSSTVAGGEGRPHPKLRLSHIQPPFNTPTRGSEQISAEKSKYHEVLSRTTQSRFDEQLASLFKPIFTMPSGQEAPSESRDELVRRPPGLAATHPSNYKTQHEVINSANVPEPMQIVQQTTLLANQSLQPPNTSSLPSAPYTDPMLQTSMDIPDWTRNRTILRTETSLENGNVVSPTWMIGMVVTARRIASIR